MYKKDNNNNWIHYVLKIRIFNDIIDKINRMARAYDANKYIKKNPTANHNSPWYIQPTKPLSIEYNPLFHAAFYTRIASSVVVKPDDAIS